MPRSGLAVSTAGTVRFAEHAAGAGPQGRLDKVPLAACRRRFRRKRERQVHPGRCAALRVRTHGPGSRAADSPRPASPPPDRSTGSNCCSDDSTGRRSTAGCSGSGRLSWDGDRPWRAQLNGRALDVAKLRPDLRAAWTSSGRSKGGASSATAPWTGARHDDFPASLYGRPLTGSGEIAYRDGTFELKTHPGGERGSHGRRRRALGPERGPALEREPADARPHRCRAAGRARFRRERARHAGSPEIKAEASVRNLHYGSLAAGSHRSRPRHRPR